MLTTIKEKVFLTFQTLFPAEMYQMSQAAVNAAEQERRERENAIDHVAYEVLVGKPVIAVGNDWSNPVIGMGLFVQGISKANRPHLVIKDYVSGEEVMPFGAVMEYNDTRFEAIMKLTPAEITSLVYRHSTPQAVREDQKEQRDSRDVILQKLTANGFFDAIATVKTDE
jgi:hypothetical protein